MNTHERSRVEDHDDEAPIALSAAGAARRDAMRDALSSQTVRIARARRVRRRTVAGVCVLLLCIGVAYFTIPAGVSTRPNPRTNNPGIAAAPTNVRIEVVRAGMTPERFAAVVSNAAPALDRYRISDDDLLRELDRAGRPTGLAQTPDGRVWLTSNVTDPLPGRVGG